MENGRELTFSDLRRANVERNAEWSAGDEPVQYPLSFRATELAGELGELCNAIKKLERIRLKIKGGKELTEDDWDEFGDVQISLDLLAMDAGVNLDEITIRKFNKTSAKHGMTTRLESKNYIEYFDDVIENEYYEDYDTEYED